MCQEDVGIMIYPSKEYYENVRQRFLRLYVGGGGGGFLSP